MELLALMQEYAKKHNCKVVEINAQTEGEQLETLHTRLANRVNERTYEQDQIIVAAAILDNAGLRIAIRDKLDEKLQIDRDPAAKFTAHLEGYFSDQRVSIYSVTL